MFAKQPELLMGTGFTLELLDFLDRARLGREDSPEGARMTAAIAVGTAETRTALLGNANFRWLLGGSLISTLATSSH